MKKMDKCEISEDFSGFCLHTQSPRRFPWFAVVVVVIGFVEILNFSMFFLNVSSSITKSTTNLGGSPLFQEKMSISIGRETKTLI